MSSGSIVAAILASDSDSGVNGEVTYLLEEDDEDGTFLLNPVTGVFNVTRPLDYETQQYYILTAKARDGGGQASTVRVYFNVLDVNDNPPVFDTTVYSTSVSESLPSGSSILTVVASDADDGKSEKLPSKGQENVSERDIFTVRSQEREMAERESANFSGLPSDF